MRIAVALAYILFVTLCISGCGGGGGGGDTTSQEFSISTTSLSFVTDKRFRGPNPQAISAVVRTSTAGTLYVVTEISGNAVGGVGGFSITSGSSGFAQVFAADPSTLEPGIYTGALTIKACMNSPTCANGQLSGSPRTVSVSYTINSPSVVEDSVTPKTTLSNSTTNILLRGRGFSAASDLRFGNVSAMSFSVISDTEIHATLPSLTEGSYPVSINGGAIPFSGSIVIRNPENYSAITLAYPAPLPSSATYTPAVYDAERRSVYVVERPDMSIQSRLIRYTNVAGTWSAPQSTTIPGLRGVIVGPAGTHLLGYSDLSVLEIDPSSLAVLATYPVVTNGDPFNPPLDERYAYINNLALTNDGYVIVTFGIFGSGNLPIYFYSPTAHTFTLPWPDRFRDYPTIAEDANIPQWYNIAVTNGDGSLSVVGGKYVYEASSGKFFFSYPPPFMGSGNARALDGATAFSSSDHGLVIETCGSCP